MEVNIEIGMRCIKYMLLVSNFMFVMIGFLLVAIGATISSIYGNFEGFMESRYFSPSTIMVIVGITVFLVSFFGCFGAAKESTMLVNVYTGILGVILLLEISAVITAYVMRADIGQVIEVNMFSSMDKYGRDGSVTETWDFTQERLRCCGVHTMQDWSSYNISGTKVTFGKYEFVVPKACCSYANCDPIYQRGCFDHLSYIITECAFLLATGAVSVALVQVLGVLFSIVLAKRIRHVKTNEEVKKQLNCEIIYNEFAHVPVEKVHYISDRLVA